MANLQCTLTVTGSTKEVSQDISLCIRETVDVTLAGDVEVADAAHYRLAVIERSGTTNTLVATCNSFNASLVGELDLNTDELVAAFANRSPHAVRKFHLILVDIVCDNTIVNDFLEITNSPYTTGMEDPTAADPIGGGATEGVTGGDTHNHHGGDGADIDHTHLLSIGTNTHAQLDARATAQDAAFTLSGTIVKCVGLAVMQPDGNYREIVIDNNGVIGTGGLV